MTELVCPKCNSTRVKRSRSRGLEHLLKLVDRRAFRCINCGWRGIFRSEETGRRGAKATTYTPGRIWLAALFTMAVLSALLYWMMREPEKEPIPVAPGIVLILGRKIKK